LPPKSDDFKQINFLVPLKASKLWRRFWPSKWTFFLKLWTKKCWKIKLDSTSKNPFEISIFLSKVMNKNQKGGNGHFLWHFHTTSLIFVHNFWLEDWNLKRIFGREIWLDFATFCSSKFFEKSSFTRPKSPSKSSDFKRQRLVNS